MHSSFEKELIDTLGEQVALHLAERRLYSSDAGILPATLTIGLRTVPAAVVQPMNKEELSSLISIAQKYGKAIVPRGAGTAGYGGAVPVRESIVVDLHRMSKVLAVDEKACTVDVEPGITWQELDKALAPYKLTLRSYPSSAISATVGGWLASGAGTGIGSYQYGYLPAQVREVELVTPTGTRLLGYGEVDLVAGMSGTTGFITRVSLYVRPQLMEQRLELAFPSYESFTAFIDSITVYNDGLWHVGFINARNEKLSRQAIELQLSRDSVHRDNPGFPDIPADVKWEVLALFVGTSAAIENVKKLRTADIVQLDDKIADYTWQERFYPMRQKALGPSLIPGEVIVPLHRLPELVRKVNRKCRGLFSLEGTLINRGEETTALFMFLDDERRPFYELAYSASMHVLNAAKKLGGRAYAAGMLLNSESISLWGRERLSRIYEFKRKIDPENLMNPSKVFPTEIDKKSPVAYLEFLTRIAGVLPDAAVDTNRLLKAGWSKHKAPADGVRDGRLSEDNVVWDALSCSGCGYCRTVCSEFNVFHWESTSPRGKFAMIKAGLDKKGALDERMADAFFMCATCRNCDTICQARIPILQDWDLNIRPLLNDRRYELPVFHKATTQNVLAEHNPAGHPHDKRSDFLAEDIRYRDEGETGYWVGCTASYAMKQLALNPLRIMNAAGITPVLFREDEWCCGSDILLYGRLDEIADTVAHNISAITRRGIKKLVVHCPGCWAAFSLYYPLFAKQLNIEWDIRVEHIMQTMAASIESGQIRFTADVPVKVTYHDPCHIGRRGNIYEAPRQILKSIPGLELVEMPFNREASPCCGRQLFQFSASGPKPYVDRVLEGKSTGASALVTCCPGCQVAYIHGAQTAKIGQFDCLDITDLVCRGMGIPTIPDKVIARMVQHGYASSIAPHVKADSKRSARLFAPHKTYYQSLLDKGRK